MATVLVDTALDSVDFNDGRTSLREAVFATNLVSGADTIEFDSALSGQTILLSHGEIVITDSLTINGLGAGLLTIDASGSDPTPDQNNGDGSRVFHVSPLFMFEAIGVTIRSLTLTGGDSADGGGAILARGNFRIELSVIRDNASLGSGGGILAGLNFEPAHVVILNTVVSSNAAHGSGGGISIKNNYTGGIAIVRDCRIYDNAVEGTSSFGGGLYIRGGHVVEVVNNKVYNNSTTGTWARGGGAYIVASRDWVRIEANSISDNRCMGSGWAWGGGICVVPGAWFNRASEVRLINNQIEGNVGTARWAWGGGAFIEARHNRIRIEENRIKNNSLEGNPIEGAGLVVDSFDSSWVVARNKIVDNFPAEEAVLLEIDGMSNAFVFRENQFRANDAGGGQYIDVQWNGEGKVSVTGGELAGSPFGFRDWRIYLDGSDAQESKVEPIPPLLGDYNDDHVVETADFVVWRRTRGSIVVPFSGADGNGNGVVDEGDYGVWRANFGKAAPIGDEGIGVYALASESHVAVAVGIAGQDGRGTESLPSIVEVPHPRAVSF